MSLYLKRQNIDGELDDLMPPLLLYPQNGDFWNRFYDFIVDLPNFSQSSPSFWELKPRFIAQNIFQLKNALQFCNKEKVQVFFELDKQIIFKKSREISVPASPPLYTFKQSFDERNIWIQAGKIVQTYSVLGKIIEKIEFSSEGNCFTNLEVPDIGSTCLQSLLNNERAAWVAVDQIKKINGLADFIQNGCLYLPRSYEVGLNGCLWLGLVQKKFLPLRTAQQLEFESDVHELAVFADTSLVLKEWPFWQWGDRELIALGGWHDWHLFFWGKNNGFWSYNFLSEEMELLAGEPLTWLESLAFETVFAKDFKLKFGFKLEKENQDNFEKKCGLDLVSECSDFVLKTYKKPGVLMKKFFLGSQNGPSPYWFFYCDTFENALTVIQSIIAEIPFREVVIPQQYRNEILIDYFKNLNVLVKISAKSWWSCFSEIH